MRALWSDRQNCSHSVSQKVKRIRRVSDFLQRETLSKRGCKLLQPMRSWRPLGAAGTQKGNMYKDLVRLVDLKVPLPLEL